jgi:hypothetical protein
MFRSDKYLKHVRQHICVAPGCVRPAEVAHHFSRLAGGGGVGIKPSDTYTVPLCVEHHAAIHQYGFLRPWTVEETVAAFFQTALRLVTSYWVRIRFRRKVKESAEGPQVF